MDRRLLTRVRLRDYKSIAACDVSPASLSFLVGPNGSGKSNFLNALRFVAEALRSSLGDALSERDGIGEVLHRSEAGIAHDFGIHFDFQLPGVKGRFALEIGAQPEGGYVVLGEECTLARPEGGSNDSYRVETGRVVESTIRHPPACTRDNLYLRNVSGLPEFRPACDALIGMAVYNLDVGSLRALQPPVPAALLKRKGSNNVRARGRLVFRAGPVPILHASSGIRRVCALAYVLIRAWSEHRIADRLLGVGKEAPQRIIMLYDEVESHRHPRVFRPGRSGARSLPRTSVSRGWRPPAGASSPSPRNPPTPVR